MLAAFLEAAALNEALPWLVMAVLLGFGAVVFWRKRRAIASPHDVKAPLPAWEQPFIPKQVLPQENEQVAAELVQEPLLGEVVDVFAREVLVDGEIGRASCRERVYTSV
jgi:hypothetical protein